MSEDRREILRHRLDSPTFGDAGLGAGPGLSGGPGLRGQAGSGRAGARGAPRRAGAGQRAARNSRAATTMFATPLSSVGCSTGAKNGEWFVGMSRSTVSAATAAA